MMIRKLAAALVASVVLLAPVGISSASAASPTPDVPSPSAAMLASKAKAADAAGYLIVKPSEGQKVGDAVFYPTGPISDSTLVVIAQSDGTLPGGLTESQLKATARTNSAALSGARATAATVTSLASGSYAWSATSSWSAPFFGGSWLGTTASARASYAFNTNCGCEVAQGQGLGYYKGYLGSTYGTWGQYYYVGWTGSTTVGATVPWGNVAANREFEALCTTSNLFGWCYGDLW